MKTLTLIFCCMISIYSQSLIDNCKDLFREDSLYTDCQTYLRLQKTNTKPKTIEEAYSVAYVLGFIHGFLEHYAVEENIKHDGKPTILMPSPCEKENNCQFCLYPLGANPEDVILWVVQYVKKNPAALEMNLGDRILLFEVLRDKYPCQNKKGRE